MKTINKSLLTFILSFLGTLLFYEEGIGVNLLIFSVLSSLGVWIVNPKTPAKTLFWSMLPTLLMAGVITVYPQNLTYVIWIFAYMIMWTRSAVRFQPLLIYLQSFLTIFESPFNIKALKSTEPEQKDRRKKAGIYFISGTIIFSFLMLYANSNPVFAEILDRIDLSFLEFNFLAMNLGLYAFLYGLIHFYQNGELTRLNTQKIWIDKSEITEATRKEFDIARITFWALAGLLALINLMDLTVIFSGRLPENVTYSEYVHQGFNTLLFTMTLAISILIFFFRGKVNFHERVAALRTSGYFWITQNVLLAVITGYKNYLYVEAYGLTYKRLAVFLCLICVLLGLALSYKKIKRPYSNWFYFNKLALYAYASALVVAIFPIDALITHYNIKYSNTTDVGYLTSLSKPDFDLLFTYLEENNLNHTQQFSEVWMEWNKAQSYYERSGWSSYTYYYAHLPKVTTQNPE